MGGQMQQSNVAAAAALYDHPGAAGDVGDAVMARWLQSAGLQHLASPLASNNNMPNASLMQFALAHIPDELKSKLVETEDKRKEFLKLHEAVDSMAIEDALKLYYADIKRGASERRKNVVASVDSSVSHKGSSEQSELERYFDNLDLLLKGTPAVDVQLKLNEHMVS